MMKSFDIGNHDDTQEHPNGSKRLFGLLGLSVLLYY